MVFWLGLPVVHSNHTQYNPVNTHSDTWMFINIYSHPCTSTLSNMGKEHFPCIVVLIWTTYTCFCFFFVVNIMYITCIMIRQIQAILAESHSSAYPIPVPSPHPWSLLSGIASNIHCRTCGHTPSLSSSGITHNNQNLWEVMWRKVLYSRTFILKPCVIIKITRCEVWFCLKLSPWNLYLKDNMSHTVIKPHSTGHK